MTDSMERKITRKDLAERVREANVEQTKVADALREYRERRRAYDEQRTTTRRADGYQRRSLGREYRG